MRKSKIIENQKKLINDYINRISILEEKNKKLTKALDYHLEDLLKNIDYALLIKDYKTTLWNNGRIEKNVKKVHFNHDAVSLPEIEIIK